jgi:hypothetical protein
MRTRGSTSSKAELVLPNGEDEAIVTLQVRTRGGPDPRVRHEAGRGAIVDGTDEYDEFDGELVEHDFDLSRPDEVERYFRKRRGK